MATRSSSIVSVLPIPLNEEPTELPDLAFPSEIYYCETIIIGDNFVSTIKSAGGIQSVRIVES
jgi:hypothetical protein